MSYKTQAGLLPAVNNVTFGLDSSERLAIVGESGSGKTTLAMAIAGLLNTDLAQVDCEFAAIGGEPVDLAPSRSVIPMRRGAVSMIFQDAMRSLDPVATVRHQFRTVLAGKHSGRGGRGILSGRELDLEVKSWLARVGLDEADRLMKLRPYQLSGGMRQRVMIALALCVEPSVLIADEPTSALDVIVSHRIMDLVLSLSQEIGISLILITHDIDLACKYVDKVLVLYRGDVQDICSAASLREEMRSPYTRALVDCVPRISDYDRPSLPTLVEQ